MISPWIFDMPNAGPNQDINFSFVIVLIYEYVFRIHHIFCIRNVYFFLCFLFIPFSHSNIVIIIASKRIRITRLLFSFFLLSRLCCWYYRKREERKKERKQNRYEYLLRNTQLLCADFVWAFMNRMSFFLSVHWKQYRNS